VRRISNEKVQREKIIWYMVMGAVLIQEAEFPVG
jgi:hypothetical protein